MADCAALFGHGSSHHSGAGQQSTTASEKIDPEASQATLRDVIEAIKTGTVGEVMAKKASVQVDSTVNDNSLAKYNKALRELHKQSEPKQSTQDDGESASSPSQPGDRNAESLKAAVLSGGFDPKSHLASKFRISLQADKDKAAEYKAMSRVDAAEYRKLWTETEYKKATQKKSETKIKDFY